MANHSIEIDCSGMTELSLNIKMKELLGFPDFYGMNWDAMIDCLSYMRQPSAGMSSVALNDDEALVIYCKNLSEASFDIAVFIDVIRAVNEREMVIALKYSFAQFRKFQFLGLYTDDYYPSCLDTLRQACADGAVQCRGQNLSVGPAAVSIHGGRCRLVAGDGRRE